MPYLLWYKETISSIVEIKKFGDRYFRSLCPRFRDSMNTIKQYLDTRTQIQNSCLGCVMGHSPVNLVMPVLSGNVKLHL
jgi:hypothetical protein